MIVIYAEKPDMGTKIAASLDCIRLNNSKNISFDELSRHDKEIKSQRSKDGYFEINFKGEQTIVTWGFGHMCELKQAQDYDPAYKNWTKIPIPFIPESYEIKSLGNDEQLHKIKSFFQKADLIICATDDDREGDLIFDYIYRFLNCHVPFKRALFNKQSKEEFIKAFNDLVDSDHRMNVIQAGRARSEGDFITGANLTTALTLKCNSSDVLSVGRVQTAVLNMIVEREKEIINFKPKDYWCIKGSFTTDQKEKYEGTYIKERIDDKKEAESILNTLVNSSDNTFVKNIESKKVIRKKPPLYSLAGLQMEANKKYGFTLNQTLKVAQSLYEKGFTTYPRTDSVYLTDDCFDEVKKILSMLFSGDYQYLKVSNPLVFSKKYFDSSKVESHFAIIPTTKAPSSLNDEEEKIYDLVAKSVICMVYPDAEIENITVTTSKSGKDFITKGSTIINEGFFKVLGRPKESFLPSLVKGENVSSEFKLEAKKTEPPKRYTEATLLNAMINCGKVLEDEELKKLMTDKEHPKGLGRPSSQASIVETLQTREYTKKSGKTIYPTQKGIKLIDVFPVEDLKSAVMTAQWEKRLDDIEKGMDTHDSFINDLQESVKKWTKMILNIQADDIPTEKNVNKHIIGKCPICGKDIILFKNGAGCSGYGDKSCNFFISRMIAEKELSDNQLKSIIESGESGFISGFKSKKGTLFSANLVFNKEQKKLSFVFTQDTEFNCPKCGGKLLKSGFGYTCQNHEKGICDFFLYSTIAGKKLTQTEVKDLLSGNQTKQSDKFKSKEGNNFSASLKLVDYKVKFVFPERETGEETNIKCPICGETMKKMSYGYICGAQDCRFKVNNTIAKRNLSEQEICILCKKKIVGPLHGFVSKSGKSFSAKLVVDSKDKRVSFVFE